MKLLINSVILILVISCVCALPKSRWMMNRGKKIKRGIYGEGFGGGGGGGIHGLNFGIPAAGFGLPLAFHQKPYVPSVYSKFPAAPFAFTHGDASVQSFQINFPKYNYVQPKPIIAQPAPFPIAAPFTPQIQFAAAQYPQIFQGFAGVAPFQHVHQAVAPAPAPALPTIGTPTHVAPAVSHGPVLPVAATPTFFFHQKPIVPVAVPVPVVPKPVVFAKPAPQHPVFTIAALTPQFVSIPYPTETPTENPSTTIGTASTTPTNEPPPSTQQPNPDGQSGTNFVTNVNPDQQSWQPMFIGSTNHFLPTPTSPTAQNVPRPPISLLPPYLGPTGPGYDSNTFFITSTNIPAGNNNNNNNDNNNNNNEQQPNQSENNFNNINPMNNIHSNNNGNEFGQGGFEIQQTHNMNNNNNNNNNNYNNNQHNYHHGSHSHNHNQHRNHHNVNQQGYGPFNGQGYDAPSNSGRYIGPSSYQVGLRTRIN